MAKKAKKKAAKKKSAKKSLKKSTKKPATKLPTNIIPTFSDIIDAIVKRGEETKEKVITTFPAWKDYMAAIAKGIQDKYKDDQEKIRSGYFLTAPWHERIDYMMRYWDIAAKEKEEVLNKLKEIDRTVKNAGNTHEVNSLLEELHIFLKKLNQV
jgi:hypothetical protein